MIKTLTDAFCALPGVGKKTAQRFSYYLLERNREGGLKIANALINAMEKVGNCNSCRTLSEKNICDICANPKRDNSKVCIVETPQDIEAIEQTMSYHGLYFVLSGYLSPIDGIGAKELGLNKLEDRLKNKEIKEIILATNTTIEGEVTAHYLNSIAKKLAIKTTRIAHGVPLGGELEYTDANTLAHAFQGRKDYE